MMLGEVGLEGCGYHWVTLVLLMLRPLDTS